MFRDELETLINKHSTENGSNTPDFILANYLVKCLDAFDEAAVQRDSWYGITKNDVVIKSIIKQPIEPK